MYITILIDVDVNKLDPYMKNRVLSALDRATGIHRVEQLSGTVYKGFIQDLDYEEPEDDDLWYAFYRCRACRVYIKERLNAWTKPEELRDYRNVLKRRKWNGHSFVATMGPV